MGKFDHNDTRPERSNVLALAMAIGLIVFFLTSEMPGGLTGGQGFLVGFFSVIILFVVAAVYDVYTARAPQRQERSESSFGDITITRKEAQDGITIHIYVSHPSSASGELVDAGKPYKDFRQSV